MGPPTSRRLFRAAMAVAVGAAVATAAGAQLPTRLTDAEFSRLFTQLSEPGGYWDSDNLLSNEASYQSVLPALVRRTAPGGVYLGVGPEQNFTYIAALRPGMAFVFDIRRGNAIELLLYKTLFEMSPTRADFVSRLFSRPRPPGLDTAASAAVLFRAYGAVPHDSALLDRTRRDVLASLTRIHGLALSDGDRTTVTRVLRAFYDLGPGMDYNNMNAGGAPHLQYRRGWRPTYAQLMTATDATGRPRSYLATEANYETVRSLEQRNLIVPVVGDFAGPKAVRAVGAYLAAHHATVTAFYTSNVEQYLFRQDDDWRRFYENVAALPLDATSTFIRSVFRSGIPTLNVGPGGSVTLLSSMRRVVAAFRAGRLESYADVVALSR